VVDLAKSFIAYKGAHYKSAISNLASAMGNINRVLKPCFHLSWFGIFERIIKHVVTHFIPEVVGASKLVVHGVDVYVDYKMMRNLCSDEVHEYITCGKYFGKMIMEVYHALEGQKLAFNLTRAVE